MCARRREIAVTTRTPACGCPNCDGALDAATDLADPEAVPAQGCYAICSYCGAFLRFDENLLPVPSVIPEDMSPSQRRLVENAITVNQANG